MEKEIQRGASVICYALGQYACERKQIQIVTCEFQDLETSPEERKF